MKHRDQGCPTHWSQGLGGGNGEGNGEEKKICMSVGFAFIHFRGRYGCCSSWSAWVHMRACAWLRTRVRACVCVRLNTRSSVDRGRLVASKVNLWSKSVGHPWRRLTYLYKHTAQQFQTSCNLSQCTRDLALNLYAAWSRLQYWHSTRISSPGRQSLQVSGGQMLKYRRERSSARE